VAFATVVAVVGSALGGSQATASEQGGSSGAQKDGERKWFWQKWKDKHNARYAENDANLKEYGLYDRNALSIDEIQSAGPEFSQSSAFESQMHGEGNLKFTSKDPGRSWWNRYGRTEMVVSPNGDGTFTHVQDANMGTLNYGRNPISHTILDIVPHLIWGHPQ
jgi:hypothetical protein